MKDEFDTEISDALGRLPKAEKAEALKALGIPDLYPARNVAEFMGVRIPAVHAWRRARDLHKASS